MKSIASFDQAPLLELRTEAGAVYLCPSRFQRMRLQWTFRHFRILPSQLLSRHDQKMIEKLCASAVVTPSRPVSTETILGVVEKASKPVLLPVWADRGDSISHWSRLGALVAAAIVIAALLIAARASLHRGPAMQRAQAIAAIQNQPASASRLRTDPPGAAIPAPRRHLAAAKPLSLSVPQVATVAPANSEPVTVERRWIAELPSGHFARPVVAGNVPAGEVRLNALIAPDGTVQEVTALSGNHKLAAAGMHAVRQWHYSPYETQATIEETQIKMNFFGPDAVSISSVAAQP